MFLLQYEPEIEAKTLHYTRDMYLQRQKLEINVRSFAWALITVSCFWVDEEITHKHFIFV